MIIKLTQHRNFNPVVRRQDRPARDYAAQNTAAITNAVVALQGYLTRKQDRKNSGAINDGQTIKFYRAPDRMPRAAITAQPAAKHQSTANADYAKLQSLDPDHPMRRKIEAKMAIMAAAMHELNGRPATGAESFQALWQKMSAHKSGQNPLSLDLARAQEMQLLAPMSQLAIRAEKLSGRAAIANGARIHGARGRDEPSTGHRRRQTVKNKIEDKVSDIGRGVETASARELLYRADEAHEVAQGFGLTDQRSKQLARSMAQGVEKRLAIESAARLGGNTSPTRDLDHDLEMVKRIEDSRTAQLNKAAFNMTPIGLAVSAMRSMGKSSSGRA